MFERKAENFSVQQTYLTYDFSTENPRIRGKVTFLVYQAKKNQQTLFTKTFAWFPYAKYIHCTKIIFSIEDFFSKCDQIRSSELIWSLTEEIYDGKLHF